MSGHIGQSLPMSQMPKAVLIVLAGALCLATWFVTGRYANQRADELISRELQTAQSSTDSISASISRQLTLTRGIPVVVALEPSLVQQMAARFGPNVKRSPLSMAEQGELWMADPQLGQRAETLQDIVNRMELSSLFVMNAAGDCVAEGHSGDGKGFTGANYSDRAYFLSAKQGGIGQQFAVGRVSNAYGLFYSAPIIADNQFVGAVATRIDLEKISRSISEKNFFITDENGVIVLAKDPDVLMQAVPGAKIFDVAHEDRMARYKRQAFATAELRMIEAKETVHLVHWGKAGFPHVLAAQNTSDNLLTVHVLKDLPALSNISTERMWWFSLTTVTGWVLLLAAGAAHHYRVLLRQREEQAKLLTQLQESNERSAALFNSTHEAVILLDGERSIDCNPEALRMFGASDKQTSLGLPPWSPIFTPLLQPDGTESELCAKRYGEQALRDGSSRFEYLYKRIDSGELFLVDCMLTAIQINGKTILQAVLRDITERNRFELELQSANQQLARRNEEQDRFLSMLSHELKTPLAVIRMSLNDDSPESRQRVERNIADINAIIERCLQTDRLQHGRIEVVTARCNLQALLDKTIADSQDPHRVTLTRRTPLPECETDLQLLGIILANLLDNALKYSTARSPIAIEALPDEHAGRPGIRIEVANTAGPAGLPDPEQLFSKYYRAPGAHAKTGSGLGLHLAAGIAHKLGGELRYAPQGDTVKFSLWIPL